MLVSLGRHGGALHIELCFYDHTKGSNVLKISVASVFTLSLLAGCALLNYDYDFTTRASEEMAPTNPSRGSKTMRVTTRTPPELEVRLVTFYSQFHSHSLGPGRLSVPRSGKVANACWRSISSFLQEVRDYFTRVFYYPVGNGISIHDLVLDEVVPGTCHLGITGIGYEVVLRAPKGEPVTRYLTRFDIAVEEGGAMSAEATIRCSVGPAYEGKTSVLRCKREPQDRDAFHLGPLATSGASLTLDFRLADMASQ